MSITSKSQLSLNTIRYYRSSVNSITYIKLFKGIYSQLFDTQGDIYKWLNYFYIIYDKSCINLSADLFDISW
jgi:hypothetical protein